MARRLLGTTLVSVIGGVLTAGRIVETEAYVVGDASSHAFRGATKRNRSMFLATGHAYVYQIYGTSFCVNVASEAEGTGAAVLIRSLEPLAGIEIMRDRHPFAKPRDLTRGPGRLCRALGIDRGVDGVDLCAPGPLALVEARRPCRDAGCGVRIGLSRETDRLLRFFERGSAWLSGPAAGNR